MIECRQILNKDVTCYELPKGSLLKHIEERGINFCLIYERDENETEVEKVTIMLIPKDDTCNAGMVQIPFKNNSEFLELKAYTSY